MARDHKDVDELVLFYSGHGSDTGEWALGGSEKGANASITPWELAAKVQAIDPKTVVVVNDSCYSDKFAQRFLVAMRSKEDGRRPDIKILSGSSDTQVSWTQGASGSAYTFRLNDTYMSVWDDTPDWDAVQIAPFVIHTDKTFAFRLDDGVRRVVRFREAHAQSPTPRFQDHLVARIGTDPLSDLPNYCVADELGPQNYDRDLRLLGSAFGERDTGRLEIQTHDGEWIPVETTFWGQEALSFQVGMRADGFPSDASSAALQDPVTGLYLVRIENEHGVSDPVAIALELQTYASTHTVRFFDGVPSEWFELWHPVTPPALWTRGPTFQLLHLGLASDLVPDPKTLSDDAALWTTGPDLLATPHWGFGLLPDYRDLNTAFEQSYPEFTYYGFRVVLAEDYANGVDWTYTLQYD